jgi:hypothetical protein
MQWIDLDVGDDCWCYVGNHKGKKSKGTIIAIVRLPGYAKPHYIVEIPTSVDPLLEVRDGFSISDSEKKHIGFLRRAGR